MSLEDFKKQLPLNDEKIRQLGSDEGLEGFKVRNQFAGNLVLVNSSNSTLLALNADTPNGVKDELNNLWTKDIFNLSFLTY